MLMEIQAEKIPCISCGTITNVTQHVDYNGGIAIFTKYVCPHCKKEFMEKDLHENDI
jgi:DNA-directed RNA polymerase subunit RPC12/RpoP